MRKAVYGLEVTPSGHRRVLWLVHLVITGGNRDNGNNDTNVFNIPASDTHPPFSPVCFY